MPLITVDALTLQNWHYNNATVELRIDISEAFTASDGQPVQPGNYKSVTCTPDTTAKTLSIPSFTLYSTTDGEENQNATYRATFYDGTSVNQRIVDFANYLDFFLPYNPTETTWGGIALINRVPRMRTYDFTAYILQTVALLDIQQTFLDGDTTPSVVGFHNWKTANTATTNYSGVFDDAPEGWWIFITVGDNFSTFPGLARSSVGDTLAYIKQGANWRLMFSSVNS